jgi:hypothetical protein
MALKWKSFQNESLQFKQSSQYCKRTYALNIRRATLQRQFRLYIPFLGIARPQPQFPHSCVFEQFIYSQDQSTYFLQQNRQTHRGYI